jgi:hypothetical protein
MPERKRLSAFYTRQQAADLFGITIATLAKMEQDGVLTPVRLRPRDHSPVLYRKAQVDAIINGLEEAK